MIGNNEIHLNEATMKEIVQYWLTNKFINKDEHAPTVVSVKSGNNSYISGFIVTVEGQDAT